MTKPSMLTAPHDPTTKRSCTLLSELGVAVLRAREGEIEQDQRAEDIMFRVSGQSRAQVFPLDLMPRLVSADEWADLTAGWVNGQGAQCIPARHLLRAGDRHRRCHRACMRWIAPRDSARPAGCRRPPFARTSAAPIWCATGQGTGWCSKTICAFRPEPPTRSSIGGC